MFQSYQEPSIRRRSSAILHLVTSDAELLEAWQGGDRTAGETLFERYYAVLVRFFANKISEDPMDLIQETFLGCVCSHTRLRDRQNFRSFLFGTAYNQLKKYYTYRRAQEQRFDPMSQCAADLAPGPSTMLAKSVEQQVLLDALRRIPVEHQVVLELFYWEELTSAEIADVLGEPHGTIRSRIRRARQLLEQALEDATDKPQLQGSSYHGLEGRIVELRELSSARVDSGKP